MSKRLGPLFALTLCALVVCACGGVVDIDGSALNPPPGGWDSHGPG